MEEDIYMEENINFIEVLLSGREKCVNEISVKQAEIEQLKGKVAMINEVVQFIKTENLKVSKIEDDSQATDKEPEVKE